ncbi:MAG: DUF86 domain-containing protein [Deltaproteobacteria bacterium]|nr:DUF86 domain-containing protein [Deltaproteobacteria bacterium]
MMTPLDKNTVYGHLKEMEASLVYLHSKKGIEEKSLIANIEERFAVERAFHLAIQNLIDIGGHILASLNINNVETYADIPARLAEVGILPDKLAKKLANMARFRNILVHEYIKVESRKLVSFLKNNLNDFDAFARAILKYLKKI